MSTEENDDLTLVHEDYIDEHSIDETTLPQQVRADIDAIDAKIDSYNLLDENDDEDAEALEREIEGMSRKIKVDIINFRNAAPPAASNEKPKPNEGQGDSGQSNDGKEKKQENTAAKTSKSGNALLDGIFGLK
jgi:hypothetical protein